MSDDSPEHLMWQGSHTVEEAGRLLHEGRSVRIQLPADLHHSLIHHWPEADTGDLSDTLAVSGGPEVLRRLAEVSALAPLLDLVPVAEAVGADVQVESPAPMIHIQSRSGSGGQGPG